MPLTQAAVIAQEVSTPQIGPGEMPLAPTGEFRSAAWGSEAAQPMDGLGGSQPAGAVSAEFQSGYAAGYTRGVAAGKLTIAAESVRSDVERISAIITQHGSEAEKRDWTKAQELINAALADISAGLEGQRPGFDPIKALQELPVQIRLLKAYGFLAERLEAAAKPAAPAGGVALPGGTFRIEHGDIISLRIFDRFIEPWLKQIESGGAGGGLPRPLPGPSSEQLEIFRGIGQQLKQGLNQDVQRIRAQREAENRRRQEN